MAQRLKTETSSAHQWVAFGLVLVSNFTVTSGTERLIIEAFKALKALETLIIDYFKIVTKVH